MEKISKEGVVIGDYAYIDGESGFCYGSYNKITNIITKYNEDDGQPYKVIVCGKNEYRYDNGYCLKGAMAYSIRYYARKS